MNILEIYPYLSVTFVVIFAIINEYIIEFVTINYNNLYNCHNKFLIWFADNLLPKSIRRYFTDLYSNNKLHKMDITSHSDISKSEIDKPFNDKGLKMDNKTSSSTSALTGKRGREPSLPEDSKDKVLRDRSLSEDDAKRRRLTEESKGKRRAVSPEIKQEKLSPSAELEALMKKPGEASSSQSTQKATKSDYVDSWRKRTSPPKFDWESFNKLNDSVTAGCEAFLKHRAQYPYDGYEESISPSPSPSPERAPTPIENTEEFQDWINSKRLYITKSGVYKFNYDAFDKDEGDGLFYHWLIWSEVPTPIRRDLAAALMYERSKQSIEGIQEPRIEEHKWPRELRGLFRSITDTSEDGRIITDRTISRVLGRDI